MKHIDRWLYCFLFFLFAIDVAVYVWLPKTFSGIPNFWTPFAGGVIIGLMIYHFIMTPIRNKAKSEQSLEDLVSNLNKRIDQWEGIKKGEPK